MWSTSVARMSHAGWCHRWCPSGTSLLVGGGVVTGSRPAHLCFAFARTCFLVLFQFVGKRWRRLDVVHGMCAGYLVGCGWWGGWRVVGVLVLLSGFWLGLGSGVGVSGGWRCLVGGSWCLVGGVVCGGPFPLDPSLTPAPTCLVCCGSWFGSSLCWVVVPVGWWLSCGLRFFSVGVGWSCGWLVLLVVFWLGLFSTWGRGCCSWWLFRFGRVLVGGVVWLRALWVVFLSGGCSRAGCVVPVGRADLDGRALRRPPLSPPTVHDEASQTPKFDGQDHTLKR